MLVKVHRLLRPRHHVDRLLHAHVMWQVHALLEWRLLLGFRPSAGNNLESWGGLRDLKLWRLDKAHTVGGIEAVEPLRGIYLLFLRYDGRGRWRFEHRRPTCDHI